MTGTRFRAGTSSAYRPRVGSRRDRSAGQEAWLAWAAIVLSTVAILLTIAYFLANFVFRTVDTLRAI